MGDVDLQPLFSEPILEQTLFPDVHTEQASDVWRVKTRTECVIVRRSRVSDDEPTLDFWWACRALFNIRPANVFTLADINEKLGSASRIPVPRVLRREEMNGQSYVVVEHMKGAMLTSFQSLPPSAIYTLGVSSASIHAVRHDHCGSMLGDLRYPVASFHTRLIAVMEEVVARFYPHNRHVRAPLGEVCAAAAKLPRPPFGSMIMLDMDPSQFLAAGDTLTALVDTEVYGVGPRELELVFMEYLLDAERGAAFREGYQTVLPFPELRLVRPVYRYFARLIAVQGQVDIDEWMNRPAVFDV